MKNKANDLNKLVTVAALSQFLHRFTQLFEKVSDRKKEEERKNTRRIFCKEEKSTKTAYSFGE